MKSLLRRAAVLTLCLMLAVSLTACDVGFTIDLNQVGAGTKDGEADDRSGLSETEQNLFFNMIKGFGADGSADVDRDGRDYYNILLIGVDRRDDSWNGNSDSMMVLSINERAKQVHMISFMRDMGVEIPGYGMNKLNAAYAHEGADLLIETLYENFGVETDNYVWADFGDVEAIMDLIGGVDVVLTPTEARYLKLDPITEDTLVHLNPVKAVKYARDRTSGGYDYGRTQRQRNVIMAVLDKIRDMPPKDLIALGIQILPYIHHNISALDLFDLMMQISDIRTYEFVEARVPFDDLYTTDGNNLYPDLEATREILKGMIEGTAEEETEEMLTEDETDDE